MAQKRGFRVAFLPVDDHTLAAICHFGDMSHASRADFILCFAKSLKLQMSLITQF